MGNQTLGRFREQPDNVINCGVNDEGVDPAIPQQQISIKDRSHSFLPITMHEGLYNFQWGALQFLEMHLLMPTKHPCLLALGPGLGKTVTVHHFLLKHVSHVKTLFLTSTGLVAQIAKILERPLQNCQLTVAQANTGEEFKMQLLQSANWNVLVTNAAIRYPYLEHCMSFGMVVVDEAHTQMWLCKSVIQRGMSCVMLSASLRPYQYMRLPKETKVFRVEKTADIIRQTHIADIRIQVCQQSLSTLHMQEYYHNICRFDVTESLSIAAPAAAYLFLLLHQHHQSDPFFTNVWLPPDQLHLAQRATILFDKHVQRLSKKQSAKYLKNAILSGLIQALDTIINIIDENMPDGPRISYLTCPQLKSQLSALQKSIVKSSDKFLINPSRNIKVHLCHLHDHAISPFLAEQQKNDSHIVHTICSHLLQQQTHHGLWCCPRILVRTRNVDALTTTLRTTCPSGLLILPLSTHMKAKKRENTVNRFKSADGAQFKLHILHRQGKAVHGLFGKLLGLWDGGFLKLMERFIVQPRVLVCDAAGDLGFDLHLSTTCVIANTFLQSYEDCLQFMGRVSRLAPTHANMPHMTLEMPMYVATLEEIAIRPWIYHEARMAGAMSEPDSTLA